MRRFLRTISMVAGSCLIGTAAFAQSNVGGAIQESAGATANVGTLESPIENRTDSGAVSGTAQYSENSNVAGNVSGNQGIDASARANGRGKLFGNLRRALQRAEDGTMRLGREVQQSIEQLGFQAGDQLLDANGQPLQEDNVDQFLNGQPAELRVLRNGNSIVVRDFDSPRQSNSDTPQQSRPLLGIVIKPNANGVVISEVIPNGSAAKAGLRAEDEIISVNGRMVSNPDAIIQVVSGLRSDEQVAIQYRRNGQILQALVTLSANSQFANDSRYPYASPSVQRKLEQIERLLQEVRQELATSNVYDTRR